MVEHWTRRCAQNIPDYLDGFPPHFRTGVNAELEDRGKALLHAGDVEMWSVEREEKRAEDGKLRSESGGAWRKVWEEGSGEGENGAEVGAYNRMRDVWGDESEEVELGRENIAFAK